MRKKKWWPSSGPAQFLLMQNFSAKIGNYQTELGLTGAQVTAAQAVCDGFMSAYNLTEQCKATMKAQTQWRDMVFYGTPKGGVLPAPPIFPVSLTPTYTKGLVPQFFDLRDQIVNAPGYTETIGKDLGIVGAEIQPLPPQDLKPNLKATVSLGNWVNFSGSMQGMSGLRVEYAPKGGEFKTVGFLTNTPGSIQISTAQPEAGELRAIFIKKNEEFGNYSPNYPVVLA